MYYLITGHRAVNRNYHVSSENRMNDWRSVERAIRSHIQEGGSVKWTVVLYYEDKLSGRPDHFTYLAIFFDADGNRENMIKGESKNDAPI